MNAARIYWSEPDEAYLRNWYASAPTADIAQALGRTERQVYQKAHALGLAKSPGYFARHRAGRVTGTHPASIRTRFAPGQEPWNKGRHYVAGGRSAETRFKPGRPPQDARNYLPIGSLRLNKDGILERKVSDDQTIVPARRWVAEHRLVWIATHGPIPSGHIVVFKRGMRTADINALTADRLECITRGQLAGRNHPRNLNPELTKLVQLKGAITRQVNRIAREAKESEGAPA